MLDNAASTTLPTITSAAPVFSSGGPNPLERNSSGGQSYWNAQYDYRGNLLFYLNGNRLYQANGTEITYSGTSTLHGSIGHPYSQYDCEFIPRPGTCDEYYIMAINQNNGNLLTGNLVWWVLNTSTWTLTGGGLSVNSQYVIPSIYGNTSERVVFAVGPPILSNGDRWLYLVGNSKVTMVRVGATGLTTNGLLLPATISGNTYPAPAGICTEAKVSADGTRLVYTLATGSTGKLVSVRLAESTGLYPGDLKDYGAAPPNETVRIAALTGPAYGVEFTNTLPSDNDNLLVSYGTDGATGSGVRYAVFAGSVISLSPVSTATRIYAQSEIERGLNGRLYAVSSAGLLRRMTVPTTTATAPSVGQAIGAVAATLVPAGTGPAPTYTTLYQRSIANQWAPYMNATTGLLVADPRGYIHLQAPTQVNLAGSAQTITVQLDPYLAANAWFNNGLSSVTTSTSSSTYTLTIPANAVPINGSGTLNVAVTVNTPCGTRLVGRAISVSNVLPCNPCGRPAPPAPVPTMAAYPNPATDYLTVANTPGAAEATLTNILTGRQTRYDIARQPMLSVASLPEGTYWLEVRNGELVRRERIVIKH